MALLLAKLLTKNMFFQLFGFRLKRDAEWETCGPATDCSWKQIAEPVMKLYTETTDGSTIEDKETGLVWCYEDADPDFGSCQAKELLDHLESVLANEPVTVKSGQNIVEVKPQVCTVFLNCLDQFSSILTFSNMT